MGLQNIFPIPIYTIQVPKIIEEKMEEIVSPKLHLLEEVVGMRTDFFMKSQILSPEEISPFTNYINHIANKFSEESNLHKGPNFSYWLQDYKKHHYHGIHAHPQSTISGTYYIRANKNAGDLEFQNPNSTLIHSTCYNGNHPDYSTYRIKPKKGLLILFPYWLTHQIFPTNSEDCIRTSFSFNFLH